MFSVEDEKLDIMSYGQKKQWQTVYVDNHVIARPQHYWVEPILTRRICLLIVLDSRPGMQRWWIPPLCCHRRHPYIDLEGMSEENFTHWRRIAKKLRHISKLGRYMAYIGHYLDLLRRIGERPSRAERARMRRAQFHAAAWQPLMADQIPVLPTDAPGPAVRADPEPEPH